jgi:hypothetical protein
MRKLYSFTFLLFVGFMFSAATDVLLVRFNAVVQSSPTNEIQVSWVVSKEDDVDFYTVKRKMSHQDQFQDLAQIQLSEGAEELDGKTYTFFDRNVYKNTTEAEPVIYALYANKMGTSKFLAQVDVNYTTTTVRRTWGSIKAMFQ